MTHEMKAAVAKEFGDSTADATQPLSVVTRMSFAASPAEVWKGLLFYEEIGGHPPARLLLPVPILKRVARMERGHFYEFEVVERALSVGGGMRLSGGRYTLDELADGLTEVAVETRYVTT